MRRFLQSIATLVSVIFFCGSIPAAQAAPLNLNCDPCIERPNFQIRAIVHGQANDDYWTQMSAAMHQAAKDMRVDFQLDDLMEVFDPSKMAASIRSLITLANTQDSEGIPDALIVTIPSNEVREAVKELVEQTDIPVFGMNSGYAEAKELGLQCHIAQDDYVAGQEAAKQFLRLNYPEFNQTAAAMNNQTLSEFLNTTTTNTTHRALFINHEFGNSGLDQRYQGFWDGLVGAMGEENIIVDQLVLNPEVERNHERWIADALEGCPYTDGILAPKHTLEMLTSAYYKNECNFFNQRMGIFDVDSKVYDAIALGKVDFAISQQQYLQGAATVTLAAMYATTGFQLYFPSSENDHGIYLSGPNLIQLKNLPSDSQQICESEGFPVCNKDGTSPNPQGKCQCQDRSTIRIGGSTPHPESTPSHWGVMWEAARQAGKDAGIDLILDELERLDDSQSEQEKIGQKYVSLCQSGVDGVFGSAVPFQEVMDLCSSLEVPFVSVSSAVQDSHQHAITMSHYNSAYAASQRMIQAGMKRGYCVQWHLSNDLDDRCFGLRDAIADSGQDDIVYEGVIYPPEGQTYHDNLVLYQKTVHDFIPDQGDWAGIGLLLVSDPFAEGSVLLQEQHPQLLIGAFDSGAQVVQYVDEGKVLFAVDQQPYLQGYLAVRLLAWHAHTKQSLMTHLFESGPQFILKGPSPELQQCQSVKFDVCPEPIFFNKNQLDLVRPFGLALAAIIVVLSLGFTAWTLKNRDVQIVKASQPFFLIGICAGIIIMASSIVPLSLDDGILHEDGGCVDCDCPDCDKACMAAPWLFTVGFTVVFAALFSKVWRLNKLVASATRFRRVTIGVTDVMVPFVILLALNVIFMLVWTLVDPMYFERTQRCGSDETTSFGSCRLGTSKVSVAMAVSVMVVDFSALLLANLQAYQARHINTDFNESGHVGIAMLSILQIFLVGTPLAFLVNDNPPAKFFVLTAIVCVICLSVLLVIFVPKILRSRKNGEEQESAQRYSSHFLNNRNATYSSGHMSLGLGSAQFQTGVTESQHSQSRPSTALNNDSKVSLPSKISSAFEESQEMKNQDQAGADSTKEN